MAKSEILMWVAGILMMVILGLAVAPTITKSGDTAKMAVINSEIQTLRQSANLWLAANSVDGTFTGLNAQVLAPFVPAMTAAGTDATATLASKANASILYSITPATDTTQLKVKVVGLTNITGAEASITTTQGTIGTIDAAGSGTASDGTLVYDYKG